METLKDWTRLYPPPPGAFRQSLAEVGKRGHGEAKLRVAVREFLDEFELLPSRELQVAALAARPPDASDARFDAFLGGLAEYLAARESLDRPAWATEPARFLTRFWFYSDVPGFRPLQIVQSPAAFRRRGIFVSAGALQRC